MKLIKNTRAYLLPFFLLVGFFVSTSSTLAFSGSGDGTDESRYVIETCEQFQEIADDVSAYYILGDNIDCSITNPLDLDFDELGTWADGYGFNPITSFSGNFDGRNYTIDGLFIDRNTGGSNASLFATTNGAVIKNVKITNASFELTSGSYEAGFIGEATNSVISGVSFSGTITGSGTTAGLIGYLNSSTLSRCSSSGTLSGGGYVGGLVGFVGDGDIADCYTTMSVTGSNGGGFVSRVWDETDSSSIVRSYSAGIANISNYRAAFVGWVDSYGSGDTTFSDVISATTYDTNIMNNVYGSAPGGGAIPIITNTVYDATLGSGDAILGCGPDAQIDCTDIDVTTLYNTSLAAPFNDGEQIWDFETVWQVEIGGLPTLLDAELEELPVGDIVPPDTVIEVGDFYGYNALFEFSATEESTFECSLDGGEFGSCSSPYLLADLAVGAHTFEVRAIDIALNVDATPATEAWTTNPEFSGSGTGAEGDAYSITSCEELMEVNEFLDAYFELDENITDGILDCTANGNDIMIGNEVFEFTGDFNGNDITVVVDIDSEEDEIGLFRETDGAEIHNLVVDGTVIGGENYTGGIVGYSIRTNITDSASLANVTGDEYDIGGIAGHFEDGIILNSYAAGNIEGLDSDADNMGGLVGHLDTDGTIDTCYATGDVTGYEDAGGLVGEIEEGTVTDSYATGNIYGDYGAGGLVSYLNTGNVYNSYATGDVTGGQYVGGFISDAEDGEILDSYSTGNASSYYYDDELNDDETYLGGFVGYAGDIVIERSYSTGNATGGSQSTGGFVGQAEDALILDSYSHGDVSGYWEIGGFIGEWEGYNTVTNSYSKGSVTGDDLEYTGGFVGYFDGNGEFSNSYWDSQTSGFDIACGTNDDCDNSGGKTTSEMKKISTFENWDFEDVWGINENDNDGYPFLQSQGYDYSFRSLRRTSGSSVQSRVRNLLDMGNVAEAEEIKEKFPTQFAETQPIQTNQYVFSRNLSFGMTGDDINQLQRLLISQNKGPAALVLKNNGTTNYFGLLTLSAVIEFQKSANIIPAIGFFGPITRAYVATLTL